MWLQLLHICEGWDGASGCTEGSASQWKATAALLNPGAFACVNLTSFTHGTEGAEVKGKRAATLAPAAAQTRLQLLLHGAPRDVASCLPRCPAPPLRIVLQRRLLLGLHLSDGLIKVLVVHLWVRRSTGILHGLVAICAELALASTAAADRCGWHTSKHCLPAGGTPRSSRAGCPALQPLTCVASRRSASMPASTHTCTARQSRAAV